MIEAQVGVRGNRPIPILLATVKAKVLITGRVGIAVDEGVGGGGDLLLRHPLLLLRRRRLHHRIQVPIRRRHHLVRILHPFLIKKW